MSTINEQNDKTARIVASANKGNKGNDTTDDNATTNVVYLADIARANGRSPKSVRARFRRLYETRDNRTARDSEIRDTRDLPRVIDRKRWAFSVNDIERVTALVVNDTRVIDDATDKAA